MVKLVSSAIEFLSEWTLSDLDLMRLSSTRTKWSLPACCSYQAPNASWQQRFRLGLWSYLWALRRWTTRMRFRASLSIPQLTRAALESIASQAGRQLKQTLTSHHQSSSSSTSTALVSYLPPGVSARPVPSSWSHATQAHRSHAVVRSLSLLNGEWVGHSIDDAGTGEASLCTPPTTLCTPPPYPPLYLCSSVFCSVFVSGQCSSCVPPSFSVSCDEATQWARTILQFESGASRVAIKGTGASIWKMKTIPFSLKGTVDLRWPVVYEIHIF